jgi:uncharacterized surface protein with fasciclin (FAS1) repeats
MKKLFTYFTAVSIAIVGLTACDNNDEMIEMSSAQNEEILLAKSAKAPGEKSIATIAVEAGFTELVGALAYVDKELGRSYIDLFANGKDQYTVFAPDNEAFEKLYTALNVNDIMGIDPELVEQVLLYHVVEGRRGSNSVLPKNNYKTITTLQGGDFKVDPDGNIVAVGNMTMITGSDISASNGMVHIISDVLLPIEI